MSVAFDPCLQSQTWTSLGRSFNARHVRCERDGRSMVQLSSLPVPKSSIYHEFAQKKNLQSWMLDDFSPSKSSDRDWEMCSRSHLPVVNPCPVYQQDSCCWPSQNLPQLAVLLLQTAVPTFHDMIGSVFTFCCKQITARVKWTWAVINWS